MSKIKRIKYYFIAAAIALLAVAAAVPAGAGDSNVNCHKQDLNRLLTGDYFQNNSFVCASAYGGFDTDLNRKTDPAGLISGNFSGSTQGITSYDGHGGFTFRGQVLTIAHDPGGSTAPLKSPISQYDMECWGTYQVNQDLSTEGEYDCRIDPTAGPFLVNPPYPPEFYMVIEGLRQKGQLLGTAGNILALRSDTAPNVETVIGYNFYLPTPNGPVLVLGPIQLAERICTNSGTGMKIVGKGINLRERGK
jgi:hypothetical protein